MSPQLENMLVNEVYPRLRTGAHSIKKVGHEDDEEITQDCTLMAARMMESAERSGQPFTAGTMVYYTQTAARSGRRSHYTGHCDVMSAICQFQGKSRLEAMDDEIEFESGEIGTLHDITASLDYQGQESDPAEEAGRNLDWAEFLDTQPPRHRIAIDVLAAGGTMREAGKRCGLKDSAALLLKRRIAAALVEFFGEDVIRRLLDGTRPGWESDLRMSRERCHPHEGALRPLAQPVG